MDVSSLFVYGRNDERRLAAKQAEKLLSTLPEREKKIVYLRLGFETYPKTYREIGEEFNFHKERARQIFYRALRRIIETIRSIETTRSNETKFWEE